MRGVEYNGGRLASRQPSCCLHLRCAAQSGAGLFVLQGLPPTLPFASGCPPAVMCAAGLATWMTPQRARLLQRHQAFTLSPAAQVVVVLLQLVATKLRLL